MAFLLINLKGIAGIVDSSSAVLAANNWYSQNTNQSFSVVNVYKISFNNHVSRYVVNYSNNGFVMTSATTAMNPILGFSTEGQFSLENMPPEVAFWMDLQDHTIDSLITYNVSDSLFSARWQTLLNNTSNNTRGMNSGFGFYLVQTLWDQGYPYNIYVNDNGFGSSICPGDRCPTGCVATAIAQIMKYWNFSNLENWDWCNMPIQLDGNSPQSHIDAVAHLMNDIGRNVGMDYCQYSKCQSGAPVYNTSVSQDAYRALQYFEYDVTYLKRKTYWITQYQLNTYFTNPIRAELDSGHPVLIDAWDANNSANAHAWVCDGYFNSGGADNNFLHFNFGWGGAYNGFYFYNTVNPSTYEFNKSQEVLFMHPNPDYVVDCSSIIDVSNPFTNTSTKAGTIYNSNTAIVLSGSTVGYQAYNEIVLNPDFIADAGSNFTAEIIPCPVPNCPPIPQDFVANPNGGSNNNPTIQDTPIEKAKTLVNNNIGITPNPNNGSFKITITKNDAATGVKDVKVYDMVGRVIWENNTPSGNTFNVDISDYAPGIYYVRALNEAGDIDLKKLIKE